MYKPKLRCYIGLHKACLHMYEHRDDGDYLICTYCGKRYRHLDTDFLAWRNDNE